MVDAMPVAKREAQKTWSTPVLDKLQIEIEQSVLNPSSGIVLCFFIIGNSSLVASRQESLMHGSQSF